VAKGAVIIHAFLTSTMYRRDRFGPSPLIPVNMPQIHMDKVCVGPTVVQEKVYKEILLSLGGI
jgi:hypothetical protein